MYLFEEINTEKVLIMEEINPFSVSSLNSLTVWTGKNKAINRFKLITKNGTTNYFYYTVNFCKIGRKIACPALRTIYQILPELDGKNHRLCS